MALAIEQYTPLDEDRWTLNQAFDHLTVTLGYSEERALREMEQQRFGGHLVVQVHKVVDGKLQGDPDYLPCKKTHKLIRHLGWVRPLGLKWGDFRCTVYRQRVLELWPLHTPASQPAPVQQLEDKTGPDPFEIGAGRQALPASGPPKRESTQEWVTNEAIRLKTANEIPANAKRHISHFAKLLAKRMDTAAKTDKSIHPRKWEHIKNMLPKWGLWPVESIKKS